MSEGPSQRPPSDMRADPQATTDHESAERNLDQTRGFDWPTPPGRASESEIPARIGKYSVTAVLGKGAFGVVYLARHPQLHREVALKVARPERFGSRPAMERFIDEARNVAQMKHPGIVSVYDVEEDSESAYIVQEFIDGHDLAHEQRTHPLSPDRTAQVVAAICEAVAHAHQHGIYHRDLKPSNILIDRHGQPHVADFGVAIQEHQRRHRKGERCGTPNYMSPEQVRGEANRIDGRSDIWALGVILYELLCGSKPFNGSTEQEVYREILETEPLPLRQLRPQLHPELERICLRCLSKRMSDRYSNALDLAADLHSWLAGETVDEAGAAQPAVDFEHIVPKGLRSFDDGDADFFLELLPGPRDRQGLPELVRFWKTKLESVVAERTFAVGLVYGPSGGGKSSLLKAGVLPRLARLVAPIYVEATHEDTEQRLLRGLRQRFPNYSDDLSLAELLAELRTSPDTEAGRKILLVFDQFEQWLHATADYDHTPLVEALRHCDGSHVQAVVIVRDDFWMAVTRFFRALEIELVEGTNAAAVDRFDLGHARKVLTLFGRAYRTLPPAPHPLRHDQEYFIEQAVASLSEAGTVVGVRLALFAEMVKSKSWTLPTLKALGGADGVGVAFLDETFGPTANPKYRLHAEPARRVLRELLPRAGTDMKGHGKSRAELAAATGYLADSRDFDDLIGFLDHELRLITPSDPAEPTGGAAVGAQLHSHYQLTHDFLVPTVRRWITRKQTETRRGRAELRLAERTRLWESVKEKQQLPPPWEFAAIHLFTRRGSWRANEAAMMGVADAYYALRLLAAIAVIGAASFFGVQSYRQSVVANLIHGLTTAEMSDVPNILTELQEQRRAAEPQLRASTAPPDSKADLHLRLARLRLGLHEPDDLKQVQRNLLGSLPAEARVISAELAPVADQLIASLWEVVSRSVDQQQVLAACTFLAEYDAQAARWNDFGEPVGSILVASNPLHVDGWIENLLPVRASLLPTLRQSLADSTPHEAGAVLSPLLAQQRRAAAAALARYLTDDLPQLSELLVQHAAEGNEFGRMLATLADHKPAAVKLLRDWYRAASVDETSAAATTARANAVAALLLLDDDRQLLRSALVASRDQSLRSRLVHRLPTLGIHPELVVDMLADETNPAIRSALLLALGQYPESMLPRSLRQTVEREVAESFVAGDAGEHAAAEWLAARLGLPKPARVDRAVTTQRWNWETIRDGYHLVRLQDRDGREFLIGQTEVPIRLYEQFNPDYRPTYQRELDLTLIAGAPGDCPAIMVSAYDAMQFCNWLSSRDGLPHCYDEVGDGTLVPRPDHTSILGYRLPTLDEWQTTCRCDCDTDFCFGADLDLLGQYGWYYSNSRLDGQNRARPVARLQPSSSGTFDMYGNVWEWATRFGDGNWAFICGGSCDNEPVDLQRIGSQNAKNPGMREMRLGFRLARSVGTAP